MDLPDLSCDLESDDIYRECQTLLLSAMQVTAMLKDKNILMKVNDIKSLRKNVESLYAVISPLSESLSYLRINQNKLDQVDLAMRYMEWMRVYQDDAIPKLGKVTDILTDAGSKINE